MKLIRQMNIRILFIWLAIVTICFNTNETNFDQKSLNQFLSILPDRDSIFLIPGSGCGACVNEAIDFAKNNNKNENYYFVFTRIHDIKLLKIKLQNSIQDGNFHFDKSNKVGKMGYYQIYPMLIERSENSIKSIQYLDEDFFITEAIRSAK